MIGINIDINTDEIVISIKILMIYSLLYDPAFNQGDLVHKSIFANLLMTFSTAVSSRALVEPHSSQ